MFNIANGEVFITGATGFIGRHIVQALVKHRFRINILCRNIDKAKAMFLSAKDIEFIKFDINNPKHVINFSTNDCLIHCAWSDLDNILSVSHTEKQFKSHCDFLSTVVKQGIGRIIVTGSFSEYGLQQGPVYFFTPAAPSTAYGVAKNDLHKFLRRLQTESSFELIWLRLFHVYARKNNDRGLFAELEDAIKQNHASFDMSSGEQILDYSDIATVAEKIMRSIFLDDGVYTVCSGNPQALKDIVKYWLQVNNYKIILNFGAKGERTYNSSAIWGGDASRINSLAKLQNHD